MSKEVNLIADSIVYAVQNEKQKVVAILLKNGVVVPTGTSDAQLIVLVSEIFKKSKPFRNDFIDLISKTEYVSSSMEGYSNASFGEYTLDSVNFGIKKPTSLTGASVLTSGSVLNTPSFKTDSNTSSTSSNSFWGTSNILGLFNKAADTYTSISSDKATVALANAAKARAEAGIDTPAAIAEAKKIQDTGSNTVLYVVLAILGIGAIGGLVWYTTKSKK